ncbi:MAG: hypothetical protein WCD79_22435 [Chthoniobacteraceae bacterium]
MKPDEALLRAHLEEAAFRSGIDRGRWDWPTGEPSIEWPHCILWVQSETRFAASGRVNLRFNLDGYPTQAPTAQPWDVEKNQRLANDKWPKGPGNVSKVFNHGWNNGPALYAPCDRMAMVGHDPWKTAHEYWWWTPDKTITHYLEFVHRCLNPLDYEK